MRFVSARVLIAQTRTQPMQKPAAAGLSLETAPSDDPASSLVSVRSQYSRQNHKLINTLLGNNAVPNRDV